MNTSRPHSATLRIAWAVAAAWTLAGGTPAASTAAEPQAGVQRVEHGPLAIEQLIDRSGMLAAERLTIAWTIRSPVDVRVVLPPLPAAGAKAGDFTVVSSVDEAPRFEGSPSRLVLVRRLVLEPFLPGRYSTPALEAAWTRGDSERGVVRTSPATIEVRSLLPAASPSRTASDELDSGSIRGEHPVDAAEGRRVVVPALVVVSIIAVVAMAAWAAGKRRGRIERDPVDAAFALANAVRIDATDPETTRRALDDLSHSLRTALIDRVDARAASMTVASAATAATDPPDERRVLLDTCLRLLARLDEGRFRGEQLARDHVESLRRDTVDLVARLHAMPRHPGGKGAA